jgi:glycosyltransferase involved in cell wall biosynthesis
MKLLFDPLIFLLQNYGGISRYYSELLNGFRNKENIEVDFPLFYSDNFHLKNYKLGSNFLIRRFSNYIPFKYKEYLKRKSILIYRTKLKEGKFDLVIPTYYDTSFLDVKGNTPFVLTVYDMIHENYPNLEKDSSIISDKKLLIEKADAIIAISENTKNDILRFYPHVSKEKIHVVYLCHSIVKSNLDFENLTTKIGINNYILFVGNRGFYKRFNWFLTHVSSWLKTNNTSLLCLGGGSFSKDEFDLISNLGLSDHVKQFTFQDDQLYFLYRNSLAFVFPSEYEGFGIPVLEAMYSGCPVILPRLTSFPEVAGDAGEYFDSSRPETLIAALDKIKENPQYRIDLIQKGFLQASKFSWKKTLHQCFSIYNSVRN